MKRLAARLLVSTSLFLQPSYGQTVADKVANPLPNSGLQTCSIGGVLSLCVYKPGTGLVSIPLGAGPFSFGNLLSWVGAQLQPRVAANASVAGLNTKFLSSIQVDGYSLAGDGGGHRMMFDPANACGAGGHPAANGVTCINSTFGSATGSWNIDWSSVGNRATTPLFGAVCDGASAAADTAAFQAAAATGRFVYAPALKGHCDITAPIQLVSEGQHIAGDGRQQTFLYPSITPFASTTKTVTGSIAANSDVLILANGSASPNPGDYLTGTGLQPGLWAVGPSPTIANGYLLSKYNEVRTQTTAAVNASTIVPVENASGIFAGQALGTTGRTVASVNYATNTVTASGTVTLAANAPLILSAAIPSEAMTARTFASGVITTGGNSEAVEDLTIYFTQPATLASAANLTTYEPGIKAQHPGFFARRLNITFGSKCIDAGDNTNAGQDVFDDIETGCFVAGITIDGATDSVRIDKHHHWPYFPSAGYYPAFYYGSVAISAGRVDDLHVTDSMCLSYICNQFLYGTLGIPYGEFTNDEADGHIGFDFRAGGITVTGGNYTRSLTSLPIVDARVKVSPGSFVPEILFTGGRFFDGSAPAQGTPSFVPMVSMVGPGNLTIASGRMDTFNSDETAIYFRPDDGAGNVDNSKNLIVTGTRFSRNAGTTFPVIDVQSGRAVVTSNYQPDSSATFIRIATDSHHVLMGNSTPGAVYALPSAQSYGIYGPNAK